MRKRKRPRKNRTRYQSPYGLRTLQLVVEELRATAKEAFEWSNEKWAKKAYLHVNTIKRILSGGTRFPQFETLIRMANAVHYDLVTAEQGEVGLRIQGAPEHETKVRNGRAVKVG